MSSSDIYKSRDWIIEKAFIKKDAYKFLYNQLDPIYLGDVNSDWILNVLDIVLVVNMVLGVDSPNYALADINSDNEVKVQDIILLLNIILED